MAALGEALQQFVGAFEKAAGVMVSRAEALHGTAPYARVQGRCAEADALASRGLGIGSPASGRAVETWIDDRGLLDEYAVATSWTGRPAESLRACVQLLTETKIPGLHRDRVVSNVKFSIDRIAGRRRRLTLRRRQPSARGPRQSAGLPYPGRLPKGEGSR